MHYQLKNGQLVPISNEELAQSKIDGADKSKGVVQKQDVVKKQLDELKAREDKVAADHKMAKTVEAHTDAANHTATKEFSNVTNSLPELEKKTEAVIVAHPASEESNTGDIQKAAAPETTKHSLLD